MKSFSLSLALKAGYLFAVKFNKIFTLKSMEEKIQLATVSDFDRQAITLSAASVNIGLIFFLYQYTMPCVLAIEIHIFRGSIQADPFRRFGLGLN